MNKNLICIQLCHVNNFYVQKLLEELKNYKNGLEDGEQKAWDMNGDLMYKYIYNDGRKYGIQGSVVCNGGKDLEENDAIKLLIDIEIDTNTGKKRKLGKVLSERIYRFLCNKETSNKIDNI